MDAIDIHSLMNIALLMLLVVTTVAMAALRNLLTVVILSGVFSLVMALLYLVLAAPDVAITEAAIGGGISTILFLGALLISGERETTHKKNTGKALILVTLTGVALLYAVSGLPLFGASNAPSQTHVAPFYLKDTPTTMGVPNVVTVTLASYRGLDTLGETFVIFTAALAVFMLLGKDSGRRSRG